MDDTATKDSLRPSQGDERQFQLRVLSRLPLAEATLRVHAYVFSATFLDDLFDAYRGRCYERALVFSTLAHLMRSSLVQHEGSGRRSFVRSAKLSVSHRAVYGKLSRLPMDVSMAIVREGFPLLRECLPPTPPGHAAPPSLRGLDLRAIDGKTLKHVERRLMHLRPRQGRVNSGKLLVALELDHGLGAAFQATHNSEANDVSLVQGLLEQLGPGEVGRPRLYICDRQFCDLPRLRAFSQNGHHFLVRHNRNIDFHPDPQRPAIQGTDRQGRPLVDEWGWLGRKDHPSRLYVRRVTLRRSGEEDVAVVSDLLDAPTYPAEDLLDAYLMRWGIERVFQQITEVFNLRNLIGGDPRATVFQAAFCLLIYNAMQVIKAYVAQAGGRSVAEVSTESLFVDVREELIAWTKLGDPDLTAEVLKAPSDASQTRELLQALVGDKWCAWWLKTPSQKNRRKTPRTIRPKKGYTNLGKLQDQLREQARKAKDREAHKARPRAAARNPRRAPARNAKRLA
jgi:hypothetical protein